MLDLRPIPDPVVPVDAAIERGIADSVAYLESPEALASMARDPYWPKWHSPWWHMVLLAELGETARIPAATVRAMGARMNDYLTYFPITDAELAGVDTHRDLACHCALGCMLPILEAHGVALPWAKVWFERYQMADGGLNCDEQAYRCTDECPSSMVGTIAPFEAMLALHGDAHFVQRAAQFLIGRALVRGSDTRQNAEERDAARAWVQPAFPRFYFYDVLRGVSALVRWAEQTGASIPAAAIDEAVRELNVRAPDGVVRVERQAHAHKTTILGPGASGKERAPATTFPLLEAVSIVGAPSAALTRAWSAARAGLSRLDAAAGRII